MPDGTRRTPAVQHAHAGYYLALVETAEPQFAGPEQAMWLERLEAEHDNLRAALRGAEARGDVEAGLRLAGALWPCWLAWSYLHEGREQLTRIMRLARTSTQAAARAKVLAGAGHLAHNQGDYAAARTLFETSLALWRDVGDKRGMATALQRWTWEATDREAGTPRGDFRAGAWLARTLGALGAFVESRQHGEEALRLALLAGRRDTPIMAHGCPGELYLAQGDLPHAVRMLEQGLALCRAAGNPADVRRIAAGLGAASALQGRRRSQEALRLTREQAHPFTLPLTLLTIVLLQRMCSEGEPTREHVQASIALATEHGFPYLTAIGSVLQGWELARGAQGSRRRIHGYSG